jgi:hypothetical protein
MLTVGAPVIEIESRVALVTVSWVLPEMLPNAAVIVTGVALTVSAVATPLAAIVATAVFDEVHVAVVVRFSIDPSL